MVLYKKLALYSLNVQISTFVVIDERLETRDAYGRNPE